MASKRNIINEEVDYLSPYEFDTTLGKVLTRIQDLVDEYGADATLDWNPNFYHPYDHDPSPRFSIYKKREETDKEYADRMAKSKADNAAREARDQAEFARLSAKYGTK